MIDATSKANRFLEAIEKYAEQQRSEMRAEVEAFREEQLNAANEEGTAAAHVFIQSQKQEIKASLAKETALKETKKKRELFEKRSAMAQQVFDEAEKRLIEFTKTNKYKEYIATSARLMSDSLGGERAVVRLRPADMSYAPLMKELIPGCEVTADESIRLGGVSCQCDKLSIIIDDTLDTKFEDRKKVFIETSGLMVEG